MTDYLPLSSLIDAVVIYLVEGIKALYRMTYAITKVQKDFIKTLNDPNNFISQLGLKSKELLPKCHGTFMRLAFKYPLGKAKRHRFS